jgi:hypothetical protein
MSHDAKIPPQTPADQKTLEEPGKATTSEEEAPSVNPPDRKPNKPRRPDVGKAI